MNEVRDINLTKKAFANCISKYIDNNFGKHHFDMSKSFAVSVIWRGISSPSDVVYMRVKILVDSFMKSYNIEQKNANEIIRIMDFFRENMKNKRKKKADMK